MHTLDSRAFEKVDTILNAVQFLENHSFYACLNDEFATFDTRRGGNIKRSAFAIVVALGDFCNGICLGMEHIRLGNSVFIFADRKSVV